MKRLFSLVFIGCFLFCIQANGQGTLSQAKAEPGNRLPGFAVNPISGEQEKIFVYAPGINIHINAPSESLFDGNKPTKLVLYALPNGNSTAWTIGKAPEEGDDWHFHIQNIGAQTRYLRATARDCNWVTVYLEADSKSWGRWRKAGPMRDYKIKETVEYLLALFSEYNPHIELNSHSGGGNFIFGFMDANTEIPGYVKRISFIDSNYNWDDKRYGNKLKQWLAASPDNHLFVACYDDANALLDGKPFVSKKGGTWHRTYLMQRYLRRKLKGLKWEKTETDSIISYTADNRRILFYSRKNPERAIYHTILVERNGYIHSELSGTKYEGTGYVFMGKKVYDSYQ
ncbi:hypothetical protein [Bacteroides clarus]|uniref:hypothetical protein n=1 Tax=Bacteroides clarus TaxID=626929 RepID=UPI002A80DECB|nr:hypothetical protein [Bacteroides clarus]